MEKLIHPLKKQVVRPHLPLSNQVSTGNIIKVTQSFNTKGGSLSERTAKTKHSNTDRLAESARHRDVRVDRHLPSVLPSPSCFVS